MKIKLKYLTKISDPYPIGDGDHGTIKPEDYIDEGIPYIRVQNLTFNNKIDYEGMQYISEKINNLNKKSIIKPGDILLAKTGTIGKAAVVPDSIAISNTTSSVGKITLDENKCDIKYVYYCLASDCLQEEMRQLAFTKSAQPGINIDDIKEFAIDLPELKKQKAIAKYLDVVCENIDKQLDSIKISIENLLRLKPVLINEITSEVNKYENLKLKYFAHDIKTGPFGSDLKSSDIKESGVPVFNQRVVIDDSLDSIDSYVTLNKFKQLKTCSAKKGDLLVSTRGTIGKTMVIDRDIEGLIHPCIIRFRVDRSKCNPYYLKYIFNLTDSVNDQIKLMSNSTTIEVLYSYNLKEISIPLPKLEVQDKIVEYLDKKLYLLDKLIELKKNKINLLNDFKKSLIFENTNSYKEA